MAQKEYIGENRLNTLITLIHTELQKYVLAVQGKGLSEEDFTTALKTKLEGMDPSTYALLTGGTFTGAVYAPTPDAGTNTTRVATTAYVVTAINSAISGITGISFDGPYASLAALQTAHPTGATGTIYLVTNSGSTPNASDEYFWNGTAYELFGTTSVDLSGYLQEDDVQEMSAADVQAIWTSVFGS